MTSALLKLPQSLSRARKEERVEQILEELVSTRQRSSQIRTKSYPDAPTGAQ